jgi:hypothetical protein
MGEIYEVRIAVTVGPPRFRMSAASYPGAATACRAQHDCTATTDFIFPNLATIRWR